MSTATNNSITKHQIKDLYLVDEVVVDCELSDYFDKREGGEVSGDVSIAQHDLNVLLGNYI